MPPDHVSAIGGTALPRPRSFRISDLLALGFAAVILAVFEWLHHAEFPPSGSRFLTALAITAGFAVLAWFAGGVNFPHHAEQIEKFKGE